MNNIKLNLGKDFWVLERVPKYSPCNMQLREDEYSVAIIDLETTGLDPNKDKITELGLIKAVYSEDSNSIIGVQNVYEEFNDPGEPISSKITELTGITDGIVKGKIIDWGYVGKLLRNCEIITCHNAGFDRKFLEKTPLADKFADKIFGCTKNDIDWSSRGYGSNKLDYLNWRLGYFYDAHRALNDCWATLNLLKADRMAIGELISNCNDNYEVYVLNSPYSAKDWLKEEGFYWNDGTNGEPKAWYKVAKSKDELVNIQARIDAELKLACYHKVIRANRRYA